MTVFEAAVGDESRRIANDEGLLQDVLPGKSHASEEHRLGLRQRLPVALLDPRIFLRSTLVFLLAVTALPESVAGSADTAELHRIVTGYYYAIGENRLEEAMSFYHDNSPQADEVRRETAFGQSAYLQRTSTLSFDVIYRDGERAITLATHRHLRIAGIKFMEDFVETRYVFRQQGARWKLWSSFSRPAGVSKLSTRYSANMPAQ